MRGATFFSMSNGACSIGETLPSICSTAHARLVPASDHDDGADHDIPICFLHDG
jgi:hypothetical protein